MAKARNPRDRSTSDVCPACGMENGFLVSRLLKFEKSKTYTSGKLCTACAQKMEPFKAELEAGGILMVCRNCNHMACVPNDELSGPTVKAVRDQINMPTGFVLVHTPVCPECERPDEQPTDAVVPGDTGA